MARKQKAEQPKHRHDCDKCKFLGRFRGHDLYVHDRRPSFNVVELVARYGSSGPEYASTSVFRHEVGRIPLLPELAEAYKRAEIEKLFTP